MKPKDLLAGLAGGLILFVTGALFYVLLFEGFFATAAGKEPILFPFVIGGEIVMGCLLAYVLHRAGVSTLADGAKTGAIFGFVLSLGLGLIMYGAYEISELQVFLADTVLWAVRYGAAGAAIGWMFGRGK